MENDTDIEARIKQHVDRLAELETALDLAVVERDGVMEGSITPGERAVLDAIESRKAEIAEDYAPILAERQKAVDEQRNLVKGAVLSFGSSVKGERLTAIHRRGAASFNAEMIEQARLRLGRVADSLVTTNPALAVELMSVAATLAAAQKVGQASVSFRYR